MWYIDLELNVRDLILHAKGNESTCQILIHDKDLTLTHRIKSLKFNFESKYHTFIFCDDKKNTQNFIKTNSK